MKPFRRLIRRNCESQALREVPREEKDKRIKKLLGGIKKTNSLKGSVDRQFIPGTSEARKGVPHVQPASKHQGKIPVQLHPLSLFSLQYLERSHPRPGSGSDVNNQTPTKKNAWETPFTQKREELFRGVGRRPRKQGSKKNRDNGKRFRQMKARARGGGKKKKIAWRAKSSNKTNNKGEERGGTRYQKPKVRRQKRQKKKNQEEFKKTIVLKPTEEPHAMRR